MTNPTLSSVSICNSALLKVGGDIISSLDEGSRASIICKALYATLRDEVMGSAAWRFATHQVQLSPDATVPVFDFQYAFAIPGDCLRALTTDAVPWTQQGPYLFANQDLLNLTYIQQNTDETSWDSRFAEALAWRLAMELGLSLVQSVPIKQECEKSYQSAIKQARALNSVVGTSPRLIADIWSGARKGFRSYSAIAAGPQEPYSN